MYIKKGNYPWNKGKHWSEEDKLKMSKNSSKFWLGKHLSEETKKKLSIANKGKKLTKEHKRKISDGLKGKEPKNLQMIHKLVRTEDWKNNISIAQRREKHWNWQGGKTEENRLIRHSPEFKDWRKEVFEKYNFTCQKCKVIGKKIIPHHINNFADFIELRFEVNNGIVLCEKCHYTFHGKYGRRNNTKEQLNEFLENGGRLSGTKLNIRILIWKKNIQNIQEKRIELVN